MIKLYLYLITYNLNGDKNQQYVACNNNDFGIVQRKFLFAFKDADILEITGIDYYGIVNVWSDEK